MKREGAPPDLKRSKGEEGTEGGPGRKGLNGRGMFPCPLVLFQGRGREAPALLHLRRIQFLQRRQLHYSRHDSNPPNLTRPPPGATLSPSPLLRRPPSWTRPHHYCACPSCRRQENARMRPTATAAWRRAWKCGGGSRQISRPISLSRGVVPCCHSDHRLLPEAYLGQSQRRESQWTTRAATTRGTASTAGGARGSEGGMESRTTISPDDTCVNQSVRAMEACVQANCKRVAVSVC